MDKKALMAIVISIMIIVLWNNLVMKRFAPPKKHAEDKVAEKVVDNAGVFKTPQVTDITPQRKPDFTVTSSAINSRVLKFLKKDQEKKEEREIVVDTEHYTAVFSSRGGVLLSWKTKQYLDSKGNPLELVSSLSQSKKDFPLSLLYKDKDRTKILNSQIGSVDTDSDLITLNKNKTVASLSFSLLDPYGAKLKKVFTFHNDSYLVDVDIIQENISSQNIDSSFSLRWARGINQENPTDSKALINTHVSTWLNGKLEQEQVEKVEDAPLDYKGKISWASYGSTYFASFIIPYAPNSEVIIQREGKDKVDVSYMVASKGGAIASKAKTQDSFGIYVGPKEVTALEYPAKGLENVMDYGWFGVIAKPLMDVLRFSSEYINSYGWSIVILTILIKLVFYPMTQTSYRSMASMQKLQPKIAELKEKYKSDPKRLQQATMEMYKTNKVNPLGGCLPMVVQIPVFFALYKVLLIAIELRHTPFLWITDLAAPDPVSTILMGVSMLLQQITTPSSGDPKQQKMMLILPVIFTFMFWSFPSGLVLYWLVNNLLTILQQMQVKKEGEAKKSGCPVKVG